MDVTPRLVLLGRPESAIKMCSAILDVLPLADIFDPSRVSSIFDSKAVRSIVETRILGWATGVVIEKGTEKSVEGVEDMHTLALAHDMDVYYYDARDPSASIQGL